MSKTVLILVDFEAAKVATDDAPLKRLKQGYPKCDLIIASRYHNAKTRQDKKGSKLVPFVSKLADVVVSKEDIGPSAFEGGALRPIESTEKIIKTVDAEHVIVGGYFLEWAVAQTAFDANALGYQTTVDLAICGSEGILLPPSHINYKAQEILERLDKAGVKLVIHEPATIGTIEFSFTT